MRLAEALALEPERLVQGDRDLVPGEDVELELADSRGARPCHRGVEQRLPHALAPRGHRDHQADVRYVRAGRVRVTAHGEAPDDLAVVALGHEHGRVRVPAERLE